MNDDHGTVALVGPQGLVDLLPHLFGFHPEDSIVLIGLTPGASEPMGFVRGRLPTDPAKWQPATDEMVDFLLHQTASRGVRTFAAYVCADPRDPDCGAQSRQTHQPIAAYLRAACHARGIRLAESLYITRTHYWSMLSADPSSLHEAHPIRPASGTFAAHHLPRSTDVLASFAPVAGVEAICTASLLDAALCALRDEIRSDGHQTVVDDGIDLVSATIRNLKTGSGPTDDIAARLLLVLQYTDVRNAALEHCEPGELEPARKLWHDLARRCVVPFSDLAAAPLALYATTAWAMGDDGIARLALHAADEAEPGYDLTRVINNLLNSGGSFEHLRGHLRLSRSARQNPATG
ncbi:DUF4192 domain-containing protein [Streptomyces sp. CB01881]|uniref:DUF4192 domain-containing protein n=1 Tax=Streptomyces sp. CB01881 TaxID=2078691 RepID=UPI001386C51B|nr:DUF4192 domain-containing protein [Streptomyces sp. CB01881]